MVERRTIFSLMLLAACTDPKPVGGRRDLHILNVPGASVESLAVIASSSEVRVPEGIAIFISRDRNAAIDFGGPPTCDDSSVASVFEASSFDTFVVVGMKAGTTSLHFRDGEPTTVPVVVSAQP